MPVCNLMAIHSAVVEILRTEVLRVDSGQKKMKEVKKGRVEKKHDGEMG